MSVYAWPLRLAVRAARQKRFPWIPAVLIAILVLTALFAGVIAPHDPAIPSLPNRLKPPAWQPGGSWSFPLGTDALGRDMLSRVIFGARVSLVVSLVSVTFSGCLGAAIGLISGYYGGKLDGILMRTTDATLAFPLILLALLLAITLGPSYLNVILAISLLLWARYARVIRGEVLSLKERDFIAQCRIMGCSPFVIIWRHLLPNTLNVLLVLLSLQVGWAIVTEATLSFIGAGVPPPAPTWGSMIADGRAYVTSAWWVSGLPGLAILLVVLAFNLLGDWVRDTLDPSLRQL